MSTMDDASYNAALIAAQSAQANIKSAINTFLTSTMPPLVQAMNDANDALRGAASRAGGSTTSLRPVDGGKAYRGAVMSAYSAYANTIGGAPTVK